MTREEIICGESKNTELKRTLPEKSDKYTKTIVAFANTQGGRLIIGVDDRTREIIGIDTEKAFRVMDQISNAVSDSCEPQIIPNIELQTISGKTLIVVSVVPGPNRPYYLKSKGKEAGTYIRVAGTTRPAQSERIRELEMEGARISWDEQTCVGYEVTEESVKKLCSDIMKRREEAGLSKRKVTRTQLLNWKILQMKEEVETASNAFVLLTSDYFPFSKTQCAVFKGTERSVFLDKREFTGPIYEQIEEAVNFVLRNIRLGAEIKGLVRKESYELPVEAVREMIVNAHCHRNMTDASCVQVAVYDDRLEVSSPGGLYNGLTLEEIMSGHSRLRNRTIAHAFNQMGLVESWGTGIRRIKEAAKDYGLLPPEFQAFDNMFRVNIFRNSFVIPEWENIREPSGKYEGGVKAVSGNFRKTIGEPSENHRRIIGEPSEKSLKHIILNGTQKKILELLSKDPYLSAVKLAEQIGIADRNVELNMKKLKERGFLIRHGSPGNGYWEVVRDSGDGIIRFMD